MPNKIYIIKRLWTDLLENNLSDAVGYEDVGYVDTESEAAILIKSGGCYVGDGYPVPKGQKMPIFKAVHLEKMKASDAKL